MKDYAGSSGWSSDDGLRVLVDFAIKIQHFLHLRMNEAITRHDLILVDRITLAAEVGHLAPGFPHDERARSRIPRFQFHFPETNKPPHGQVTKIQGRRPNPAYRFPR